MAKDDDVKKRGCEKKTDKLHITDFSSNKRLPKIFLSIYHFYNLVGLSLLCDHSVTQK